MHNSDADSIDYYTKFVFKYEKEAMMELKEDIWPYLKYFLMEKERVSYSQVDFNHIQNCSGYKRIKNIFVQQILASAEHGRKCIQFSPKKRTNTFKLERRYKEEENDCVVPWKSNKFKTYQELEGQAIGISKLGFTRHLWPDILPLLPHHKYYHTGVTLLRQDGQVDLFEVNKDDNNVFRLMNRNAREMIAAEKSPQMFFDNGCLKRRGALDTKKTLFRLARVHNRTFRYHLTGFNCDFVATWAISGRIEWTTAVRQWDLPLPTYSGDVDKSVLLAIEEQLQEPGAKH